MKGRNVSPFCTAFQTSWPAAAQSSLACPHYPGKIQATAGFQESSWHNCRLLGGSDITYVWAVPQKASGRSQTAERQFPDLQTQTGISWCSSSEAEAWSQFVLPTTLRLRINISLGVKVSLMFVRSAERAESVIRGQPEEGLTTTLENTHEEQWDGNVSQTHSAGQQNGGSEFSHISLFSTFAGTHTSKSSVKEKLQDGASQLLHVGGESGKKRHPSQVIFYFL